uniref:E3 ubiquitin-protein ligase MARCH2 n=2 Tax=Lygus hesperus TaxID=30085 RepID=A0A0A9YTD8_LYGHE
MIKKEAIDRLQTLIDRLQGCSVVPEAQTDLTRGRSIGSGLREFASAGSKDAVEWKAPERLPATLSYYTTVIDDPSNIDASSSMLSGPICRICHGRHGTLVKPCRCRGTLAYVHVECLQVWLTEKEVNFCELCNYTFRVIHVPEYKIIPSIGFWYKFAATNHQKRMIMVDLTLGIVLLPFLIFLTIFVRSLTCNETIECDEDEEFEDNMLWHFGQATLKVATFLVILSYIVGVFVRINHHLSAWFSWYVNKNVTIVLEDRIRSGGDEAD